MDFLINRIEKIEYSLAGIEKFMEEVKSLDSDVVQLLDKYSLESKIKEIQQTLDAIKRRVKNDQVVEKSDYLKLRQMKNQYEDLAEYLSQNREINIDS
jgi:predicted MPP superfamily phosphohydrolase